MKQLYFIGLLVVFTLLDGSISAQEMSLDSCIRYALTKNLSYADELLRSDMQKESLQQSKRDFLPSVSAGSSANKRFGRSIDPTTNTFVNQNFFAMNFYLDSQIEIFQGFTHINRVKFEKLRYLISREDMKQKEMEIAFGVMNAYYDVLYYSELYQIVQEQMKLSELNVKKTKKMIELGLKAESDLLEMNAQQASESHNLIVADNKREQALLDLKRWMNYPQEESLEVLQADSTQSEEQLINTRDVYLVALGHMPSVQRAKLEVEAARKQLAMARGALLPRLSFGFGLNTNYADSRKMLDNPGAASSGLHTIPFQEQWKQNMAKTLYLQLQIPIFDRWKSQSRIKQAKLQRRLAMNQAEEAELRLYQMINEDVHQINALYKELQQLEAKTKALKEAFHIAEKKLDQGLINVIEFYTAKNQLAQAEADRMRTKLQLKVKEKTLRFYMGEKIY